MLWTIASIFLFFWILGLAFHVLGSYIHLLFLLAIATVLINFIRGEIRLMVELFINLSRFRAVSGSWNHSGMPGD